LKPSAGVPHAAYCSFGESNDPPGDYSVMIIRMTKMIIMITKIATMWANACLRLPRACDTLARERVRKVSRFVRAREILPGILVNVGD